MIEQRTPPEDIRDTSFKKFLDEARRLFGNTEDFKRAEKDLWLTFNAYKRMPYASQVSFSTLVRDTLERYEFEFSQALFTTLYAALTSGLIKEIDDAIENNKMGKNKVLSFKPKTE